MCKKQQTPAGARSQWRNTENGPEAGKVQTMIGIRVLLCKEYARIVKWVRALSPTLVATVRIPVVCRSMIGVAYIQLTISNNCETDIGLACSLRSSLITMYKLPKLTYFIVFRAHKRLSELSISDFLFFRLLVVMALQFYLQTLEERAPIG